MSHTPGPWVQSRLDPHCIVFIDEYIEPGFQSNVHAIAKVRGRLGETEGNIALIIAAPDLLTELIAYHDREWRLPHEGLPRHLAIDNCEDCAGCTVIQKALGVKP